jgi:hypothetical protein
LKPLEATLEATIEEGKPHSGLDNGM